MSEALEWAADYATRNKLFDAPLNQRGYPMDGWKGPTAEEKRAIITKLARDAYEVDPETSGVAMNLFLETILESLDKASSCMSLQDAREWLNAARFPLKSYIERKGK